MKSTAELTLAGIVAHNRKAGGHYFDADTLRFFGQYVRDFRLLHLDGRVIVYARAHRGWDFQPPHGIASLAEYDPATGSVSSPDDVDALKAQVGALLPRR